MALDKFCGRQNQINSIFLILKNDSIQSSANRKFRPMSCVSSNYITKILDHPSFSGNSNRKVPRNVSKNISIINDKFVFWKT